VYAFKKKINNFWTHNRTRSVNREATPASGVLGGRGNTSICFNKQGEGGGEEKFFWGPAFRGGAVWVQYTSAMRRDIRKKTCLKEKRQFQALARTKQLRVAGEPGLRNSQ